MKSLIKAIGEWLQLVLVAFMVLQFFFIARVAWMSVSDPASTAFERSQAWQIISQKGHLAWRQDWRPVDQISVALKRAVLASEDSGFVQHKGVWWDAVEKAWRKNANAQAKLEAQAAKAQAAVGAAYARRIGQGLADGAAGRSQAGQRLRINQ